MEGVVVFTRRDPATVTTLGTPVVHVDRMEEYVGRLDVVVNCGGSATDLDVQGPAVAALFNTVDSFDTHANIPAHFTALDDAARAADDHTRDTVQTADALADLTYVIYGMALELGIPLGDVLREVQASNMSKLGADGKPIYREDGKVLKGPGFFDPDIAGALGL